MGQIFQPVFADGWAPTITEKDLMGFVSSSETSEQEDDTVPLKVHGDAAIKRGEYSRHPSHFTDSDGDDHLDHRISSPHKGILDFYLVYIE